MLPDHAHSHSSFVGFRSPPDLRDAAMAKAASKGLSLSELVRRAVSREVETA